MSEMVERVAKVIYSHYPVSMGEARISARAAIAAMREPTRDMLMDGYTIAPGLYDDSWLAQQVWEAMIDAALEQK